MSATPIPGLAHLIAQLRTLQRPLVEQLTQQYPTARVMAAESDDLKGTIGRGDQMLVEPCDSFGPDGVYMLLVGNLTVLRKVRMLVMQPAVCLETATGEPEVVPLERLVEVEFIGRVVASCAVRRH